jgi:class 3 adenylate cyclase/predicted ATPase
MTFDDVLEQVITLLKRQGRVSYRALKRRFDLDDEYIEDLKAELIQAQRLALDEDGVVLAWAGEPSTQEPASQPSQIDQQPPAQEVQPTQIESSPQEPHTPDAERRQLTVMFCDLVDSTKLSSQLDPEDYREVVRAYQATCTEVIQRFDGHVAQLLGDGLLVYFGYPVAHEEDAQRAIHTGLGIVEAIGNLYTRLVPDKEVRLAVRLGIHTGLVVVGEMGGTGRQEQLALGETPNIAARIQNLAQPDAVVMSADTYRLVQGFFECEPLGEQDIRGVSQPIAVYRVLRESGAQSRLDIASTRGLTPLVGREQEVGLLLERWEQAKDRQGQVILLSGEAGIGKSRLVQVLREHVANEPHVRWECRSSPYYQNTALYPLTDLLQRALQWQQNDGPEQHLEKLEHLLSQYRLALEETVPLFAPLLSLPLPEDRYPLLQWTPQRQRQKTLEAIVAILLELAEHQPVLFILEDLHWTDPTTLELLSLLVEQVPTTALYTLLTCRPHFQPSWHHRSYLTEITVNRLSRNQIARMAQHVSGGKTLPSEIIEQLVGKTDGVPLFVEEMTKALLESGHLKEVDGHYELTDPLPALAIPATLQDSLMARLDRLVTAKAVAQYASVIGRQFSYELLQAVSQLDEVMLQHELSKLIEAELVYQRGLPPQAMYTFKHALVQDTAYESLLRSTRQQCHAQIATILESRYPETAEAQPELLAYHYTKSGLHEQAVGYWRKAGQRAVERSAYAEAIGHLPKGLEALKTLPVTPERIQQELGLQISLGSALIATKGYGAPRVEYVYNRARELCSQLKESPLLFPILAGLRRFYSLRGSFQIGQELGEQLLALATRLHHPLLGLEAHFALGNNAFWQGDLDIARGHFALGLALDVPQEQAAHTSLYGQEPRVTCLSYAAFTAWLLGYPDEGHRYSQEALSLAHVSSHPNTVAYALAWAANFHQARREIQVAQEMAEALIALSEEQRFLMWLDHGTCQWGWALAIQGQQEGLVSMRQGLTGRPDAPGAMMIRPLKFAWLAEAYGVNGQADEGLIVLAEAQDLVDSSGGRWYEPELHRLKGELLLQLSLDNHIQAVACFQKALDVARHQQAKSWELRAATSLARLWQSQGKRQAAYDLLAPVYGWFTEGFDTKDLQEAKGLLEVLGDNVILN